MNRVNHNRIPLYDNLKYLLIVLVVVGHFTDIYASKYQDFQTLYIFIYAVHMPLFLFVAGHFHRNSNILPKVLSFIAIGFALKMVLAIIPALIADEPVEFTLLVGNGIFWYMFALSAYIALSYVLRNIDKRFILVGGIILACFVGYDSTIGDFLCLSRIVVFYPFYIMGEMVNKRRIVQMTKSKLLKIVSAIIILLWAVICLKYLDNVYVLRPLFTGRNAYDIKDIFLKWGFFYRLLCYAISIVLGASILCLIPNRKIPIVTKFGSRTLQVFFWHKPVELILLNMQLPIFLCTTATEKIAWLLCAVVVVNILSLKCFEFPTKWMIKGSQYRKTNDNIEEDRIMDTRNKR